MKWSKSNGCIFQFCITCNKFLFSDVETEVIPGGGNPDWLYNQSEPVLCNVEEYGEPAFPNYSTIEGSDEVSAVFVFWWGFCFIHFCYVCRKRYVNNAYNRGLHRKLSSREFQCFLRCNTLAM
jgi:hypothetical protein